MMYPRRGPSPRTRGWAGSTAPSTLLIIGEIITNALLCTPHLGGRGAFVVLVFFCPCCLWVSVCCAGVEQTREPHLRATQPTSDCEGGQGLAPGPSCRFGACPAGAVAGSLTRHEPAFWPRRQDGCPRVSRAPPGAGPGSWLRP